jgi:hypothetical protein
MVVEFVVDVASDALLDSPGRVFWPIIIITSSRGTHAPRPSFCTILLTFCSPRCRLISLTPSLVSCVSTCVLD